MGLKRDPEKHRAWQRRSKGLKRGPGPQRTGYIRSRNPERRAKMFARNFGERSHAVRAMDCLCAGKLDRPFECNGDTVAAHAIARGMGGCKGDRRQLVNLCAKHHDEAGENRTSQRAEFEAKWVLDLLSEAESLALRLDDQGFD